MNRALVAPVRVVRTFTRACAGGSCEKLLSDSRVRRLARAGRQDDLYPRSQTRYYRLDLGFSCPLLTEKGVHLITDTRGTILSAAPPTGISKCRATRWGACPCTASSRR